MVTRDVVCSSESLYINQGVRTGKLPDGLLIYVPLTDYDSIAVLDANRLVSGQDPLITNIGAFRAPVQLTVSPVSKLSRALRDDNNIPARS